MVIFFIILISLIVASTVLIACSTLKLDIQELILVNKKLEKFEIVISLNLFNKIKWLKLRINKERVKKIRGNTKLKVLNKILDTKVLRKFKNARKIFAKDWKHVIKEFNRFEIEKIDIRSKLGTENAATTALITGTISAILGIILSRKIAQPKYKIEPLYIDKNYIYLSINCIIAIKLVHIINMNKKLGKEVYQENGRTSNRRAYANSNG